MFSIDCLSIQFSGNIPNRWRLSSLIDWHDRAPLRFFMGLSFGLSLWRGGGKIIEAYARSIIRWAVNSLSGFRLFLAAEYR